MALSKHGPWCHDFVGEMNRLVRSKDVPWIVMEDVVADGNCWYHTVIVLLNDPQINQKINGRARGITSIQEYRFKLAHFMETDPMLHANQAFILQRDITLANENLSWEAYLARVRTPYKDADELVTLCTALFVGKNIMQVSYTNTPERPWSHVAGPAEGWPAATAPPLTIGYLNQRHYMPLRREPSNTDESQCAACKYSGSNLKIHLETSAKNCKYFYELSTPQLSQPLGADGRISQPTQPLNAEPSAQFADPAEFPPLPQR